MIRIIALRGAAGQPAERKERWPMRPATGGGPPRDQEVMRAIADDSSSGRVAVAARLPTEPELAAQHHGGRHTGRQAIRGLFDAAMVDPRPPSGRRYVPT